MMTKKMLVLPLMVGATFLLAGCNTPETTLEKTAQEEILTLDQNAEARIEDFTMPGDCLVSSDGCNTCRMVEGGVACTTMQCETKGEQKCIDNDLDAMLEANMVEEKQALEELILGKTLEEATQLLAETDKTLRIVAENGKDLPITMDLVEGRVNVKMQEDKVTEVIQIEHILPTKE